MEKRSNVFKLAMSGLLIAMSIGLTRFLAFMITPTIRFGIGEVPLMFSGILLGPVYGGAVGAIADIIGVMINSHGAAPHPGMTLSSALWGIIPGLFMYYFRSKKDYELNTKKIILIVTVSRLIISLGLNSYWLSRIYGAPYKAMFINQAISALIHIPIYSTLLARITKAVKLNINYI